MFLRLFLLALLSAVSAAAEGVTIRFEPEILSILTTKGCNSSACHGAPAGQNGFKLSLYGSDPAADHAMIVSAAGGRRVSLDRPETSLLLRKPSFALPHGGGHILQSDSDEYRTLLLWLEQGAKRLATGTYILALDIEPRERILRLPAPAARLRVTARLSDGSTRDMTREVRYASKDDGVATVNAAGLVAAKSPGLTVITARGAGKAATAQFIVAESLPRGHAAIPQPDRFIDREVLAKWNEVGIEPYPLTADAAFLRRVFLDAIGVLPTPAESEAFLNNPAENKRARLIDALLDRPEYTQHWLVKFEDWFRNSQYYSQGRTNASFKRWLADAIRADKPYNQTAREMLTATGDTTVHPAGNFWHPAMDFMLKTFEVTKATPTVTRLFLGQRIECAECHNHPLENLTQDDYYGLAAFFARLKVKHGYAQYRRVWFNSRDGELLHPNTKQPVVPRFLDGTAPKIAEGQDRREVLANWILDTQKMQFARAAVNRLWAEYFGAGIVEPADDFRSTNMASHPALLDSLAKAFIDAGYRFKPIHRLILNSRTYQSGSRAEGRANGASPLEKILLARYEPRRLPAEVLLDAIGQLTGVPESFPNYPPGTTAKDLVASIGSTYFLNTFGHPRRDIMEPRDSSPSLAQALHLMNADSLRAKLQSPKNILTALLEQTIDDRAVTSQLYLRALARPLSGPEWETIEGFLTAEKDAGRSRRRAFENLLWALINSKEFQLNQ